ncbi:MAG: glucosamine-6-phosphate deaminase [Clostridia bacterium]|nr:glucosamine-6-phosphate deaminase [Clostridia bacterium]
MTVIKTKNYEEMSYEAAKLLAAQIVMRPDCVLGLATGSTPIGTYDQLVKWYEEGKLDFSKVRSVNLDEYCGLDGDNDQSYRYFMDHNLFDRVNIDKANTNVPNGKAADPAAEGERYDALIAELGGVDIQVLGIGYDGHIGFNEPGPAFIKPTHMVDLDPITIEANARFFASADDVPRQAITMGMGGIMSARKVLLIANGAGKKDILMKSLYGPITPEVPASLLQLHPDLTVICAVDE